MLDQTLPAISLSCLAIADLRNELEGYGHNPDEDQWLALKALLDTFDTIANGKAEPALYLSALDPGVGKTSALMAYLRRLLQSPEHHHVGVLLCLSRLDEIKRLKGALSADGVTIAIVTSDLELNALSNAAPGEAQLLIITQQRLELICRSGTTFDGAPSLFYMGSARALRIWDESFLPGRPVTPSSSQTAALLREIEATRPEAYDWMKDLFLRLGAAGDGEIISIPQWTLADDGRHLSAGAKSLKRRAALGDKTANIDKQTLEDLQALAGRSFSARQNGLLPSRSLAAYIRSLPDDLLPLVVLDASGRVRTTYADLSSSMAVTRLPSAVKDYSSLTINVWNRGGGKSGFDDDKKVDEIVSGISSLIQEDSYPGKWLIITHKPGPQVPDIERLVKGQLTSDAQSRVAFLTWGNHSAVNDHADAERVILAGTLFYSSASYEALKRLCLDKGPEDHPLTKDDFDATAIGESGHLVLQGLCRASVRRSTDGAAVPCVAYLIASAWSRIRAKLPEWFPGCDVQPWMPKGPKELTGHALRVYGYISRWSQTAGPDDTLPFTEVYRRLGIGEKVFRDVRRNEDLRAHLAYLGLQEVKAKKYSSSFGFIDDL